MSENEKNKLKLIGKSQEDLEVISAYSQDSIVAVKDIIFLEKNKIFVMIINRFMWDHIYNNHSEEWLNEQCIAISKKCENFIAFIYNESSSFNTPFWKTTREKTKKHLTNQTWTETLSTLIWQCKVAST